MSEFTKKDTTAALLTWNRIIGNIQDDPVLREKEIERWTAKLDSMGLKNASTILRGLHMDEGASPQFQHQASAIASVDSIPEDSSVIGSVAPKSSDILDLSQRKAMHLELSQELSQKVDYLNQLKNTQIQAKEDYEDLINEKKSLLEDKDILVSTGNYTAGPWYNKGLTEKGKQLNESLSLLERQIDVAYQDYYNPIVEDQEGYVFNSARPARPKVQRQGISYRDVLGKSLGDAKEILNTLNLLEGDTKTNIGLDNYYFDIENPEEIPTLSAPLLEGK